VFLEAVDQGAHAVVPQLDGRGVQRDEDPWPEGGQQQTRRIAGRRCTSWDERRCPWPARTWTRTAAVSGLHSTQWGHGGACLGQHGGRGHDGGEGEAAASDGADNVNREGMWRQTREGRVLGERKGDGCRRDVCCSCCCCLVAVSSPNAMCPREFQGPRYPLFELAQIGPPRLT
jgi:hypothetical protein